MMPPIVKVRDASVVYNPGKPTEFKALQDINLEIYPEEFVIFFGPSGSGKSTLLYLIAGLETPTTGTISVGDYADISKLSPNEMIQFHRASVGMIFQAFYLIPGLTAKDNVLLPMVFAGTDPAERERAVNPILDRFGISDFKDRTPGRLSGGQQQRVAIGRSLINDPAIVLADEPVGNLDSKNAEIVLDLIADLKKKDKKTVILVTHDPLHLDKADRVFYIKDGRIIKVATKDEKHGYEALKERKPEELKAQKQSILTKFAKLYPNLNPNQVKAKILTHHTLIPYDIDTLSGIEDIIAKYLAKEIDEREMYQKLDASIEEGGISLYRQTAQKIVSSIMELAKEIELIEKGDKPVSQPIPNLESPKTHVGEIISFVLEDFDGELNQTQINRFNEVITHRLSGKINADELEKSLDLSVKLGGIGLNRRTAKHFSEKIEILIMKGVKNADK